MKWMVFSIGVVFVLGSCNPTKIVTSWRDPEVVVKPATLSKFVVAAFLKNQTVRRNAEDLMASYYPGKAVQSYKQLGETELKGTDESYNLALKTQGFDGIVVMRLLQVSKEDRYIPGTYPVYYRTWGLFYGSSWSNFYSPGYYTTDKVYTVEVNVYSFLRNKLVWTATTSTVNPSAHDAFFDDVVKTIRKKMIKEGFLK